MSKPPHIFQTHTNCASIWWDSHEIRIGGICKLAACSYLFFLPKDVSVDFLDWDQNKCLAFHPPTLLMTISLRGENICPGGSYGDSWSWISFISFQWRRKKHNKPNIIKNKSVSNYDVSTLLERARHQGGWMKGTGWLSTKRGALSLRQQRQVWGSKAWGKKLRRNIKKKMENPQIYGKENDSLLVELP